MLKWETYLKIDCLILNAMKTTNIYSSYLQSLGNYFNKIAKTIISRIPTNKVYFKSNNKSTVQIKNEEIGPDAEKHHHRPISKPVVEKQTLLKETKKAKGYR
jgi:urate oxidase